MDLDLPAFRCSGYLVGHACFSHAFLVEHLFEAGQLLLSLIPNGRIFDVNSLVLKC